MTGGRMIAAQRAEPEQFARAAIGPAVPSAATQLLRPGISVVVPSHRGREHVGRCLEAVCTQVLDRASYEVVVVLNGESDGSRGVVESLAAKHPDVELRLVELLGTQGVGRARNAGIAAARREYLALVDDDDWVSPTYLPALWDHAADDVVPLARLVDVRPDGTQDADTRFNRACARRWGTTFSPADQPGVMSLNACRLLPTTLVKSVRYDEDLRSGVDVEFMARLYATGLFHVHGVPPGRGAVYYRSLRPMSVSRQVHDFAFAVEGRLDVIERIAGLVVVGDRVGRVAAALVAGQAGFIQRYLQANPDDLAAVLEAIERRGLSALRPDILGSG